MRKTHFGLVGALILGTASAEESQLVLAFTEPAAVGSVTNDGVMGGLSDGSVTLLDNGVVEFSGVLSTENNGGFSSWTMANRAFDLSGFAGLSVYAKGDGRLYKLRLQTDELFNGSRVSFEAPLPVTEEWTDARVNFADLRATWRGRALERVFDPTKVSSIGVILADKVDGPFLLQVESVKAAGANLE